MRLGSLTHVLLQYLPDLPPESRSRAGLAFLGARAGDLDAPTREDLLKAALAVIGAPELAPLFGPESRAEVAVSGKIALPREKSIEIIGRIDRLGIAGDDVLVADFKTGAPCATADIPARYLMQMALYRAVLAPLWPAKRLRMLLIWTDGPLVATLDDALLDGALAAVA
ncbi:hypothetical protein MPC1_7640001 [Methylocella tundrae]|nr:hypothetical protein MPC1_7640001 [Methylocella tundrae]